MNIDELLEKLQPEVAKAFKAVINDINSRVNMGDLRRAILTGDVQAVVNALGYSEAAARPLTAALERVFEAGGLATAATFPKRLYNPAGPVIYRFNIRNLRAEQWLKHKSGDFITLIDNDIRDVVRNMMNDNFTLGRNPKEVAYDLVGRIDRKTGFRKGGVIGLNEPQERAVAKMRLELQNADKSYFKRKRRDKKLDDLVERAFEKGKLDKPTIERIVGRYKNNLLLLRGETIGRDGSLETLNRAQHEAYQQINELGAVDKDGVKRVWDSSGPDGRTRDSHLELEGVEVDLNEPFVFKDGTKAMHPQDRSLGASAKETINCRCRVRIKVDWLKPVTK